MAPKFNGYRKAQIQKKAKYPKAKVPPKKRKRKILKNGKFADESAQKKPPPLQGEGWKLKISAQILQN